jgi:glycosyltransferase involved in cell wall biosynthesis
MRVLILHNRYQISGGEDGVVRAEQALLEAHQHTVVVLEVSNDQITGVGNKLSTAIGAIYSLSSKQQVKAKIIHFKPDIVHVHNFFPLLSPAVYDACAEAGIPVVQTLHNYRLVCPRAMPFRDGRICEDCFGQSVPWPGVWHGCYRNSRVQSAVVATMIGWHHFRGTWQQRVDAYIALSDFQKQKLIQANLPEDRIFVKSNFVFDHKYAKDSNNEKQDDFALFVGRLSEEKGVEFLIDAYLEHQITLPLKIVGDGPLKQSLQEKTVGLPNISFIGRKESKEVAQIMQQAQFLVFPSIWYEGFPLTIAEAYANKLPVIAPNLGTMSELVVDHGTGLHFESGNSADLASKIQWAIAHPESLEKMGESAYDTYQAAYTPDVNYRQLIYIYESVINRAKSLLVNS